MSLRVATVAVLGLLWSGCGAESVPVPPSTVEVPPVEVVKPPHATLNGVAGRTATVCGAMFGECSDVFDPPRAPGLPLVDPPFDLVIPEGTTVDSAKAWVMGPPVEAHQLPFSDTTVGPPPAGAYVIDVHVVWPDGSDVAYQWGLGPVGD